jgi:hypothetical protein
LKYPYGKIERPEHLKVFRVKFVEDCSVKDSTFDGDGASISLEKGFECKVSVSVHAHNGTSLPAIYWFLDMSGENLLFKLDEPEFDEIKPKIEYKL